MITCPKCAKENQDHYKFCLGCGAELPRENAPKPFSPQTPPHGVPAQEAPQNPAPAEDGSRTVFHPQPGPMAAQAAQPAPAGPLGGATAAISPSAAPAGTAPCPQCGQPNAPSNKFCASCGYNLARSIAPAAARPAPAGPAAAGGTVLVALRADGTEAGSYTLPDSPTVTLGRDTGAIFAGDSYLSPRHATFSRRGGDLFVKDEDSLNGVYVKLRPNQSYHIEYDDVFRIGQEIIRFEALKPLGKSADGVERFGSPAKGYVGRLALVIGRDTTGNSFPVPERGVHLGRERGDILFSEDGYVSGLHCSVAQGPDGGMYLTDVGSSNGTFLRLRAEHQVLPGDVLLMGQQLFRIDA